MLFHRKTSWVDDESAWFHHGTAQVDDETGLVCGGTGLVDDETGLVDGETGLVDGGTCLVCDETGLDDGGTGLFCRGTGLVDDETGLVDDEQTLYIFQNNIFAQRMRLVLLPLFFLYCFSAVAADEMLFDVLLYGKKIGNMTITKSVKGDTVHYILQGRSRAKILWMEYDDISRYEAKYKGNKMLYCKYKEDMNGKLKYFTEIIYNGLEYIATTKSTTKKIYPEAYPSLLSLYYKEPIGVQKIFLEAQLINAALEVKNPGHYVFKNNEGHNNEYIYKNGQIDELIFETALATVRMKRAK